MKLGLETPLHLNGKPTHCHHCNNGLATIRNIYKGRNCSRFYCGPICHQRGEALAAERELIRIAKVAGHVH